MTIAVVVPVYNRPSLVRRALQSINRQTLLPAEVIVVDDGSTDETANSAREWLSSHAEFAWDVVSIKNSGPAGARIAGERLADGERRFVAFLDSDDEWPDDFLARCRETLVARPDAVGAVADRQTLRDGVPYSFDHMRVFAADPVLFVLEHGGGLIQCCLFRRDFYRLAGGFDPDWRTGEDGKMLFDLSVQGPFLHSAGLPVLVHQRTVEMTGGDVMSVSLADARDFWIWADQMERLISGLPREARRQRYAAICELMLVRWSEARRMLRKGHLRLLAHRATWRKQLWKARRRLSRWRWPSVDPWAGRAPGSS